MRLAEKAFTMVELLSTIAIIAMLVAIIVPIVGSYVEDAKRIADQQTLTVLNGALNRYKTQGGTLGALTSGASVGNVLKRLQQPVSWAGTTHQFLQDGEDYNAASLGAMGEGQRFRFTSYGSYADGSAIGSEALRYYAGEGIDVGDKEAFDLWMTDAINETGSSNYLALTNPTDVIQINVDVENSGDKVFVWWGDGTTDEYSPGTEGYTVMSKTYGSTANRAVMIVGNIKRISSNYDDGRSDWGGDITTMKSLYTFYGGLNGSAMSVHGDISTLPLLRYILVWGANTLSGNIAGMTQLKTLDVTGSNTLTGDCSALVNLASFKVYGSNTISGSIEDLDSVTFLSFGGNNTLTGDVSEMNSITYINAAGDNTLSGDITGMTQLTKLSCWGTNTLTGDAGGLTALSSLAVWGNNTVTGWGNLAANATGLSNIQPGGTGVSLNQAEVDAILAGMVANMNENKPESARNVVLNYSSVPAPSASGMADVATLQGAGWTVTIN